MKSFIRTILNTKRIPTIAVVISMLLYVLVPNAMVFAEVMHSTQYRLESDSLNFGGNRSSSASYITEDTIGEVGSGNSNSTSYKNRAGYQQADVVAVQSDTHSSSASGSGSYGSVVNVVEFFAVPLEKSISLNWSYPAVSNIESVKIVRSDKFYPTSMTDGETIFEGSSIGAIDYDVVPGVTYYYALFAKNINGEYSSGVLAQARIPVVGEEPSNISKDPFENVPNAQNVDKVIRELTLADFDFIQDGKLIAHADKTIPIHGGKDLTISLAYGKVPEILKTIAVSLFDPEDDTKVFTFLLRVNKDKTAYTATIGPLLKSGDYKLNIIILDYKNQGLKRLNGDLRAVVFEGAKILSYFNNISINILILSISFILLLILILAAILKKKKTALASLMLLIALGTGIYFSVAKAAINKEINYQGKLFDSAGDPVSDGYYNMRFKLYTSADGATPIWSETWCKSPDSGSTCDGTGTNSRVSVTDGLFSVMLGSISTLNSVDFNQPLYLGVDIGTDNTTPTWDGEMTPRKKIGAVPAAFEADKLDGISSEQFLRSDAQNATTSSTTFLNVLQSGAGKVAEFFGQGSASVLSILSDGKVGIGTTTPTDTLSVNGPIYLADTTPTATGNRLYANGGDLYYAGNLIGGATTGNWTSNGTDVWRPTGNVGVGTTSPAKKLQVYVTTSGDGIGIDGTTNPAFNLRINGVTKGNFAAETTGNAWFTGATLNDIALTASSGNLALVTGTTARLYVSAAGNVGIGTTSPYAKLSVTSTSVASTTLALRPVSSQTANIVDIFNGSGSLVSVINTSGFIGLGSTSPTGMLTITNTGTTYPSFVVEDSASPDASPFLIDNAGLVGIGTSTPDTPLTIYSGTAIDKDAISAHGFNGSTAEKTMIRLMNGNRGYNWGIRFGAARDSFGGGNSGDAFVVNTKIQNGAEVERFRISKDGYVGIGSTTPFSAALSVYNNLPSKNVLLLDALSGTTVPILDVKLASTSKFVIDSSGKVGINTASPLENLDLSGGYLNISGGAGACNNCVQPSGIKLASDASTNAAAPIISNVRGANSADQGIDFRTYFSGTINAMRIIGNGNVGIGSSTPYSQLSVGGNSTSKTLFALDALSGQTQPILDVKLASTSKFMVDSSGNVGVGVTAPTANLVVSKSYSEPAAGIASTTVAVFSNNNAANASSSISILSRSSAISSLNFGTQLGERSGFIDYGIAAGSYQGLVFGTLGVERMRIDGNGYVGIGSTSPLAQLSVGGRSTGTTLFALDALSGQTQPILDVKLASTSKFMVDSSGNVGIGTTNPGKTLDVVGNIQASGAVFSDTVESKNSGNLEFGYVNPSDYQFCLTASCATTAMVIKTTSGNVGIGTTSPSTKLVLSGSSSVTTLSTLDTATTLSIENTNTTDNNLGTLAFRTNDANGTLASGVHLESVFTSHTASAVSADFLIQTRNAGSLTEKLRVTGAGNVGIGTTSPLSKLSIQGSGATSATSALNVTDSTGKSNLYVRDDGLVGIGVLAPTATLDVRSTNTSVASFYLTNGTNRTGLTVSVDTAAANHITTLSSTGSFTGGFAFNTGATEAMRINTSGNVGIGTSTINTITRLALDGTSTSGTWQSISNGSVGGKNYWIGSTGSSNGSGVGKFAIYDVDNASYRFILDGSGNVGIGTTTPRTIFDIASASSPTLSISNTTNGTWAIGDILGALDFYSSDVNDNFPGVASKISSVIETDTGGSNVGLALSTASIGTLSEKLRISSAGYVGIGTTTPISRLQVTEVGTSTITLHRSDTSVTAGQGIGSIDFASNDSQLTGGFSTGAYMRAYAASALTTSYPTLNLAWGVTSGTSAASDAMTLSSSGNLGIGTTTPTTLLQVTSASESIISTNRNAGVADGTDIGSLRFMNLQNYNAGIQALASGTNEDAAHLRFMTSPSGGTVSERLRITSDGYVGIGTTTPTLPLEINGGGIRVNRNSAQSYLIFNQDYVGTGRINSVSGGGLTFSNSANSTEWARFNSTGAFGIGTTTPSTKLSVWSTGSALSIGDDTNTSTNMAIAGSRAYIGYDGTNAVLQGASGKGIEFNVNNGTFGSGTAAVINTSGYFGIGTTSPYASLAITNTGSDPSFVVEDSTSPDSTPFIIDASGKVGIGTATPSNALDVYSGNVVVRSGNEIRAYDTTNVMTLQISQISTDARFANGYGQINLAASTNVNLQTYYNSQYNTDFTLQNGGKIGISTTSPYSQLSVGGKSVSTTLFALDALSGQTAPILDVKLASTSKFMVDASGNVGVGTAAPSEKLSLYGASGLSRSMTLSNDTTYYKLLETLNYSGSDSYNMGLGGDIFLQYDGPAGNRTTTLGVNHASGEVIINGNVGIGTTTPISKLGIQDTAGAFITLNSSDTALIDGDILGGLDFYSLDTSTGMSGVWGKIRYEADSTWDGTVDDGADLIFSARTVADGSLQDKMVLKASGNVGIGTTTPDRLLTVSGATSATTTIETITANKTPGLEFRSNVTGNNVNIGNISFNNSNGDSTLANIVGFQGSSAVQGALIFSTRNSTGFAERMRIDTTGNMGIGTSTPMGTLSIGSGQLILQNGSATTPSTGFADEATSGIYRPSAGVFGIAINGAGRLGVNASNSVFIPSTGSYGISSGAGITTADTNISRFSAGVLAVGTGSQGSTAGTLLAASIGVGSTSPYASLSITNTGTSPSFVVEDSTSPDGSPFIIDASGNVGIGTASLTAKLNIEGGAVYVNNGNVTTGTVFYNKRNALFDTGSTDTVGINIIGRTGQTADLFQIGSTTAVGDIFTVSANGNIGIGTTTPYANLSVLGGSTASDTLLALNNRFRFQGDGVMKWGVTANAGFLSWGATNAIVGSQSGYDLSLYANGGEKMKITTAGLVGISSTTPYASLSVTNTGTNPSFVVEDSTSPDSTPFIIDASGNVGIGGSAPGTLGKVEITDTGSTAYGMYLSKSVSNAATYSSAFNSVFTSNQTSAAFGGMNAGIYGQSFIGGSNTQNWNGTGGNESTSGAVAIVGHVEGRSGWAGTVTNASSFLASNESSATGGGVITNLAGFRMLDAAGTGTITNQYGLYINNLTRGSTSNYGVYQAGTSNLNYFGGSVGIGSTTPYASLSITNTGTSPSFVVEDSTSPDTSPFIIDANGDVGIGTSTTSATYKLSVQGTQNIIGALALHSASDLNTSAVRGILLTPGMFSTDSVIKSFQNSGAALKFQTQSTGDGLIKSEISLAANTNVIKFGTAHANSGENATERMRIDHNGNIGIGTSSPYAVLTVANTATTTANTPLLVVASTTNGTATSTFLTVQADGKVGIGTANPTYKLEIAGGTSLSSLLNLSYKGTGSTDRNVISLSASETSGPTENGVLTIRSNATDVISFTAVPNATSYVSGNFGVGTTTGWGLLSVNPNGITGPSFVIGSSTATSFVVDNGGKVGIGIANPTQLLNLYKSSSDVAAYVQSDSGSQAAVFLGSTNTAIYRPAGTTRISLYNTAERLSVLSTGEVGIGTTSPYAALSVVGNVVATNFTATSTSATSTFAGGVDFGSGNFSYDTYSGVTSINSLQTGNLNFDTDAGLVSWTDMALSSTPNGAPVGYTAFLNGSSTISVYGVSAGNGWLQDDYPRVAIGSTTAPSSKLTVFGNGTANGGIFELVNSASTTLMKALDNGNIGIASTSPWRTFSVSGTVALNGLTSSATGNALCITASKEVTDSGGASCTPSSIRFKENVLPMDPGYALGQLAKLSVVNFDYKEKQQFETNHSYGMIAEDVEKIDKNLVDYGYDGKPVSLHFEKITGLLVQAVQEQQGQIGNLGSTTSRLDLTTNQLVASSTLGMTNMDIRLNNMDSVIASLSASTTLISAIASTTVDLIASSTANSILESKSFVERVFITFMDSLEDTVAKIKSIFVGDLHIENKLCVDDVCVNKEQLKALLIQATASSTPNSNVNSSENSNSNQNNNVEENSNNSPVQENNNQGTTTPPVAPPSNDNASSTPSTSNDNPSTPAETPAPEPTPEVTPPPEEAPAPAPAPEPSPEAAPTPESSPAPQV